MATEGAMTGGTECVCGGGEEVGESGREKNTYVSSTVTDNTALVPLPPLYYQSGAPSTFPGSCLPEPKLSHTESLLLPLLPAAELLLLLLLPPALGLTPERPLLLPLLLPLMLLLLLLPVKAAPLLL